jgi:hypothetical protein
MVAHEEAGTAPPNLGGTIAFTYRDGTVSDYVNGEQVGYANQTVYPASTQPVYIGWFDYFKGRIDEVQYLNALCRTDLQDYHIP